MKRTARQKQLLGQDPRYLGMAAYNKAYSMDMNPYHFHLDRGHWTKWNEGFLHRIQQQEHSVGDN